MDMLIAALEIAAECANTTESPAAPWWGLPVFSFASALLGAAIGALASWITTRASIRHAKEEDVLRLRRDEYLNILDAGHALTREMRNMMANVSGLKSLSEYKNKAERDEAIRLDKESGKAIDQILLVRDRLEILRARVQAVGSGKVQEELDSLIAALDKYFAGLIADKTKFIAKDFRAAMEEIEALKDDLAQAVRVDLGIDKIIPPDR